MTNTLKISVAAFITAFAIGGVAQAEGIKIDLAGKDAKTIHDEIVQAALAVCRDPASDSVLISSQHDCVVDTIAKAEADAHLAAATKVAKADLSPAYRGDR